VEGANTPIDKRQLYGPDTVAEAEPEPKEKGLESAHEEEAVEVKSEPSARDAEIARLEAELAELRK